MLFLLVVILAEGVAGVVAAAKGEQEGGEVEVEVQVAKRSTGRACEE